jgi:hypothetical protein
MRRSNNNGSENGNEEEKEAKEIILREVQNVHANPSEVRQDGCVACHVLFTLVDKMQISESNASDLLSQILFHDPQLNDSFIEMVENIHMKQRKMAIPFVLKSRNAKDRHIESNFKNFLEELSYDVINYGHDLVLRKLMISSIALEIAQNIGIDYHAATEELYYYMRKNDDSTNALLMKFNDRFYKNIKSSNDLNYG